MTSSFPDTVLAAIRAALPPSSSQLVPLHEPWFQGQEWRYLQECLNTGYVSSVSDHVTRFEQLLAETTGASHVVATVNGTAALHIALLLAGVETGDEVLVPPLTFVATANAISYCNGTPHFVDIDPVTLGIDVAALDAYLNDIGEHTSDGLVNRRTEKRIRAVIGVHVFGHPCDLDPLLDLCRRHRLVLIEDAAEALGSLYKKRHVGTFGMLGILSFNGNKIITTGGGGAILANDPHLAATARHLTTTAKIPHDWASSHDRVGYNYRMPGINAALGCAQLEQLPVFLTRKRTLAYRYRQIFQEVRGVSFLTEPPDTRSNYWLNTIVLDQRHAAFRDEILARGHQRGLGIRPAWDLLHTLPMYRHCPRMPLQHAETIGPRLLNLPSGPALA